MPALIGQSEGEKVRTYISVKDAWKLYRYKQQYLRRLLCQKKLSRRKIGQVWLIEVASLENYLLLSKRSSGKRCGPRTKKGMRFRWCAPACPTSYLIDRETIAKSFIKSSDMTAYLHKQLNHISPGSVPEGELFFRRAIHRHAQI